MLLCSLCWVETKYLYFLIGSISLNFQLKLNFTKHGRTLTNFFFVYVPALGFEPGTFNSQSFKCVIGTPKPSI